MVNGYMPTSLKDALVLLATTEAIPYAGGTDLMLNDSRGSQFVFLQKISELKQIRREADMLYLGAACTFTDLLEHEQTPLLLREALATIAAPAIRNEGTIGGNIANGSAKADSALIFFVADATLKLQSIRGERILPIREFYQGRKQLALQHDELIVEVQLPLTWLEHYYFKKIGARKSLAISRISFAGLFHSKNGVIEHCATAFGAVSDVIVRRDDLDAMLVGKTMEEAKALKDSYLAAFDEAIQPIRGRVSSEYRKEVCHNLLQDFLATFGL